MSLDRLGKEINDKHFAFKRSAVQHAKMVGELLMQAKVEVKKQSLSWTVLLKFSCPEIKERTAQLYMQVAKNYDDLSATVADFDRCNLKDIRQILNARNSKQPRKFDRTTNYLVDVQQASSQFEERLDLFLYDELDAYDPEDLFTVLEKLASLESRINQVRNRLADYQKTSANCPRCGSDLYGLESCLSCGWNVGELNTEDCI